MLHNLQGNPVLQSSKSVVTEATHGVIVGKSKNYRHIAFVDSSLAMTALGYDNKARIALYSEKMGKKSPRCSTFLRKEFIWRLVRDAFKAAAAARMHDEIDEAFRYIMQEFGARPSKNLIELICVLIMNNYSIRRGADLSVELIRTAESLLHEYDMTMGKPVHNNASCQIGGIQIETDFRRPHSSFQKIDDLAKSVSDCKAKELLTDSSALPNTRTVKKLAKELKMNRSLTCSACKKIGDAIIVFELPHDATLMVCDKDAVTLAESKNKTAIYIDSLRAVEGPLQNLDEEE